MSPRPGANPATIALALSGVDRGVGTLMGATYRVDRQRSAYAAVGNIWESVESAGASADLDTGVAAFGARYGFATLEAGPYVAAHANLGWVDYQSRRPMGGNLGVADGGSNGAFYAGRADLGTVTRLAPYAITPQLGVRVGQVSLASFTETGSELALSVAGIRHTSAAALAGLDVGLDPQKMSDWTVAPSIGLGYERALNNPQVDSTGALYGFTATQSSAFASRNLLKLGAAVTAQRGAFTVKAALNGIHGDAASAGLTAQVTIGATF